MSAQPSEDGQKSGAGQAGNVDHIVRFDDVPAGELLSGHGGSCELDDLRKVDIAIIGTSQHWAVGLFSENIFGTAKMYGAMERAKTGAGISVRPVKTNRDVIRLVYEQDQGLLNKPATDTTEIERIIRGIIDDAMSRGASDIHIETRNKRADVLFRINGERVAVSNLAFDTAKGCGQVLYMVHADSSSKDVDWSLHEVAESAIDWETSRGERLQLRFSSAPLYPTGNFHIVIRLMSTRAQPRSLVGLGYSPAQLRAIDEFTTGSGGMVLMCGPTNSGKSTSLQSLIARIFETRGRLTKVITVEDPVELVIDGACQISVGRRKNQRDTDANPFAAFLRGALRQDPDVVMMGEIRDESSAMLACDLALAGRKVFVTLHTYSALWAFSRLRELGVRPELLTMPGFISGLCYQKLVPTLCEHCRVPEANVAAGESALHDALIKAMKTRSSKVHRRGPGCKHCNGTGIGGRTLASEIVTPDRHLLALIAAGKMIEAESYWLSGKSNPSVKDGIVTSQDHLLLKILEGDVSIQDAIANMGIADEYRLQEAS